MTAHRDQASVSADAAHRVLAVHAPEQEAGICPICLVAGPCQPANAAANHLVDLGLPVLPPISATNAGRGRLLAYVGPALRAAQLLTFGWRRRPGLVNGDGGR